MMQFTFIDMAGATLFVRDDATRALWTVEEYSLELEFPYIPDKAVSIGQRIFFIDPNTGAHQIYEVKQAKTYQPDGYQEVVAEHICVSELSDEHIDESDVTDEQCATALADLLDGTLWSVGTKLYHTSSVSISRGSVWQAVLQVKSNWNVYIEPRVTLANNGTITRYLDIISTDGVWNGVRLGINKNMIDPSVTYDDSNVYTALYGYGGTITSSDPNVENKECDFADVVWTATSTHPAKPSGQKYLLDPVATQEHGRNGRARFGYYQNTDITDPETLLQKTWETLKTVSTPSVSIEGSVADLYRMGYADQPLALHDIALVDIAPVGYKKQIQIIRMTVDLLDPTATTLTIGAYIPNIIYINKATEEAATGTKGGGGKNTDNDSGWKEFRTSIQQINNGTTLRFQSVHNDIRNQEQEIAVQTGRIDVCYDKITAEVEDRRQADTVLSGRITVEADRITEEVTQRKNGEETLSSRITIEAGRITQEVTNRQNADSLLSSRITQTDTAITAEVNRATAAEGALSGRITVEADRITAEVSRATGAESGLSGRLTVAENAISAEVTNRTNADSALSGRIDVNANKVALVVSETSGGYVVNSASIVAGINGQTGSYVKIEADTIDLTGYVTASQLTATNAKINNLEAGRTVATALKATLLQADSTFNFKGYLATWRSFTFLDSNNTPTTATFMIKQS